MKRKILLLWMGFHLAFILVTNAVSTYDIYREYAHKNWKPLKGINQCLYSDPAMVYGIVTGAETGYGFFGYNVRSNGLLIAECNGEKLSPEFRSFETSLRFFSLTGSLTDELLHKTPEKLNRDSLHLKTRYHDLAIKNIAIILFNKYRCADTSVTISYNLLDFPCLSDYRKNKSLGYRLEKIKIYRFSL